MSQTTPTPVDPTPVPAPQRGDRSTFSDRVDAFITWLTTSVAEFNSLALNCYNNAVDCYNNAVMVAASVASAAASAVAAATSAATAIAAPGTSATSTTSLTVGTGSKSLTIQTGKSLSLGMQVIIADTAAPGNFMAGYITSYTSGTGALVINVMATSGSGTFTAWTVSISGIPGGFANPPKGLPVASAATIVLDAVIGEFFHLTGSTGPITTVTLADGVKKTAYIESTPTFVNSANLDIPGGLNYTAAIGDKITFTGDSSSVVRLSIMRENGQAITSTGFGGSTTGTGSGTLTATSPANQSIQSTNYGQYVTLPDATTCILGVNLFTITNSGDYPYGIKNNAGTQLGWIPPHTSVVIGLAGQSSAAGVWTIPDVQKVAVTASVSLSSTAAASTLAARVVIDATHTLFLWMISTGLVGIIYDSSALTWGSITSVASGSSGGFGAILSGTNQVLLAYATTAPALSCRTLTTSGTTITANTAVPATFSTSAVSATIMMQIVAVGASFVCSYLNNTSTSTFAITIVGTVPTMTATLQTTAAPIFSIYTVSSTLCIVITLSSGGTITIQPYTITGTVVGAGTAATATGATAGSFRSGVVGSNWYVIYAVSTLMTFGVISISGTTASMSTAASALGAGAQAIPNSMDVMVNGNNVLITASNGNTGLTAANICTNTAGVASIGTALTTLMCALGGSAGVQQTSIVNFGSTSALVVVSQAQAAAGAAALNNLSISGTTLSLAQSDNTSCNTIPTVTSPSANQGSVGAVSTTSRSPNMITSAGAWYTINGAGVITFSGNSNQIYPHIENMPDGRAMAVKGTGFVAGAAANELWASANASLQRIECVA